MKKMKMKVPSLARLLACFGLLVVLASVLSACHGHGSHGY